MKKVIEYNPLKDKFITADINQTNFLFNVCFMVTKKCNFKCIHCSQDNYTPECSLERYKKFIDKLKRGGLIRVNVSGGESLLYPKLVEFLKYCHNKKLKVTLSTNGYLLPQKLKEIQKYIDNIRMSIYGIGNTHNLFTSNNNSFKRLTETLELLKERKIPALMIMPVSKSNINEVEKVVEFCKKYAVKRLRFFTLIDMGRAKNIFKKERLSNKDIRELKQKIIQLQDIDNSILLKVTNWTSDSTCCFLIEPNGECWFYYGNKKEFVGSLITDSLNRIWNNFKSKNLINYLINLR